MSFSDATNVTLIHKYLCATTGLNGLHEVVPSTRYQVCKVHREEDLLLRQGQHAAESTSISLKACRCLCVGGTTVLHTLWSCMFRCFFCSLFGALWTMATPLEADDITVQLNTSARPRNQALSSTALSHVHHQPRYTNGLNVRCAVQWEHPSCVCRFVTSSGFCCAICNCRIFGFYLCSA